MKEPMFNVKWYNASWNEPREGTQRAVYSISHMPQIKDTDRRRIQMGDSGSGRETLQLDVKVWGLHGPVAWDPCTLGVLGSPGTGELNRKLHFPVGTWVS